MEIFRILGIPLVHGWVVPDGEIKDIIKDRTYNQLQDKVSLTQMAELQSIQSQPGMTSSQANKLQKYEKIKHFLDETASQLTSQGLERLHVVLEERTLAVLFRNNHFSTIYKYKGAIYSLATDIGFLREDRVVWENLNQIAGNTHYCNSAFIKTMASNPQTPDKLTSLEEEAAILFDDYPEEHDDFAMEMLKKEQEDASLALAIAMQEKFEYEEAKAAADMQRKMQASQQPTPAHRLPPDHQPSAPPAQPMPDSREAAKPVKKKKKCLLF